MKSNAAACRSLTRLADTCPIFIFARRSRKRRDQPGDVRETFLNARYRRHPGDCDLERLQSPRYRRSQFVQVMASPARENPAALKYRLCLSGFMRPDTSLQIVELAESAKTEVAKCHRGNRQSTHFQSDAAAT